MTEEMNADASSESAADKIEDVVESVEETIDGVVEDIKEAVSPDPANDVVYDHAAMMATDDDKLWSLLAFVFTPLISIVLMFMDDKKDRPFIKANSMQALILGIANIVLSMTISPFLCGLPSLALWLYCVYLGFKAYGGEIADIPVVSNFAKNQGWI